MSRSVVGPTAKRRPSSSVTGQMPNNAFVTNTSSAAEQLGGREIALLGANAERARGFEHDAAHDALDAAARKARRGELAAVRR